MTRVDIIGLSELVLEDLTNRGTLRRAHKQLSATEVTWLEDESGHVQVHVGEHTCDLTVGRPFPDWTCTCTKATSCHHIVAAVLAYQNAHLDSEPIAESAASNEPETTDPALGTVFERNGIHIVRMVYPEPVTVRFLQGTNLDYARCTCANPDPCRHVAPALALLRAPEHPIRAVGDDEWHPDPDVLSDVEKHLDLLCAVGIESSHEQLKSGWIRVRQRCLDNGIPHLADIADTIIALQERRAARDCSFDPQRLLSLVAELATRLASLQRVEPATPHRLVAGVEAEPVKLSRSTFIGLGTEVLDLPDGCEVVAHLVDARSGSPVTVHTVIDGDVADIGNRTFGGMMLSQWGSGQVMVSGGRRDARGRLDTTRYKSQAFPSPALTELFAPWVASGFAELFDDDVPAALGIRGAGHGMCAVTGVTISNWRIDPITRAFVAELTDEAGDSATLAFVPNSRTFAGHKQLEEFCAQHSGKQVQLSGRWHSEHGRQVLNPMLLVGEHAIIQPHLARGASAGVALSADGFDKDADALFRVRQITEETLQHILVAGTERLERDPHFFPTRAAKLRNSGATWLGELVDEHSPASIRKLLWAVALS
ncbi:SWIM zinc finger family protein [Corynebacterium sp. H130]|uniref:SWIM zinc finger family protein n=1 Tax=Corynebacterium sp. H130 TaxID=3133444 RepID=UPI0030A385D0